MVTANLTIYYISKSGYIGSNYGANSNNEFEMSWPYFKCYPGRNWRIRPRFAVRIAGFRAEV
jgi:hypothetical protein